MKPTDSRKTPRFFIINPVRDRRTETRYESMVKVHIVDTKNEKIFSGLAFDIGRRGLRLESPVYFDVGLDLQVVFVDDAESTRCFGYVTWLRRKEENHDFELGVQINSWHGIVEGPDSWKKFKGLKYKRDRRRKLR